MKSHIGLWLGVGASGVFYLLIELDNDPIKTRMAAIAILMAVFWITEAVPLAATALLPLVLFPVAQIASTKSVAAQYMNSTVFLLIGGFMLALAMQRWDLHKRIALSILVKAGAHPASLLFGFMVASAGMSMWISNTATTLVMLPIAMAILAKYQAILSPAQGHRYTTALLLAIAYSASVGGMMTLIGTAPNLVFSQLYESSTNFNVGFIQWMLLSVPVGVCILLCLAFSIYFLFLRQLPASKEVMELVRNEQAQLGKTSYEEKMVLTIFSITALLWMTRKGIAIPGVNIPGWSDLLAFGKLLDDGSVAVAMASLLFFIPTSSKTNKKSTLLNEEVFKELPWSVIVLFGGGFALAYGFVSSGLSVYLASLLRVLQDVPVSLLIGLVTAGMSLLTELTSNTATTQLVLPIIISTSEAIDINPLWMMIPVTFAASCAFMFPVATPPNAIVFASGKVTIADMVTVGFLLNSLSILIISLLSYWFIPIFYST